MRKRKTIQLEVSIRDREVFQSVMDSLFVDIIKHTLEHSNASYKEKVSYLDSLIKTIKSR